MTPETIDHLQWLILNFDSPEHVISDFNAVGNPEDTVRWCS